MDSIFRVPWSDVGPDDVRRFLEDAGDEGITWEAKAADPRKPDARLDARVVREAACGLANAVGGFILLGVARDKRTGAWDVPGVVIAHEEPETWLDDVIGSLSPRPRHDAHVWNVSEDRRLAVVRIEPVAEPPCLTPGGEISSASRARRYG
jgi:predicted HTH transcriptional regulator